ncbi:MAG: acyl-CoA reductase [Candidatus Thermoplasmatota archaeon]|nr:acyl-CoA reductase [Candidatus Thermoplasmatota archaeon]
MINCYLLDGEFKEKSYVDFAGIADVVNENRVKLSKMPLNAIIELMGKLGKQIIRDDSLNQYQGISYISLWLRKDNLRNICKLNYSNNEYLDHFTKVGTKLEMYAQPRGIVCHWVAGNMPTLAFFSAVQAILSRNGSIIKVPEDYKFLILSILNILNTIEIEYEGDKYYGNDIVKSISIVSFNGHDHEISTRFSLTADCKLVYGGSDAIKAIASLPQKESCDTIIYGPKYSFAVFDKEYIENDLFDDALKKCMSDVSLFNQMACSSPHTLFFEKSKYSIEEIAEKLKVHLENLPEGLLKQEKPQWMAANTINARGMYLLGDDTKILKSEGLEWTILINEKTCLEEPIFGKCVFVKEISDIDEVLELITRKIQAITVCVSDQDKRRDFAINATYRGVDRITTPGHIHDYDLPWDGILPLNRLVRWVILKNEKS